MKPTLWIAALLVGSSVLLADLLTPARADDLDRLKLPIVRSDDYALAITAYSANSEADLIKGRATEHSLSLDGLLYAEEDEDVLCFQTRLVAKSALDDRDEELLDFKRGKKDQNYAAVLPNADFPGRGGKPIPLTGVELADIDLQAPAYKVETLILEATAVVIKEREDEELSAEVADRFVDLGHDIQVQVTAKEVDAKGMMTIKLDLRRARGDKGALVDSLYALNSRGKVIGGGRWTNELDLFAGAYEVEMVFPLNQERTVDKLRLVLATEYEVQKVQFEIEELFQK